MNDTERIAGWLREAKCAVAFTGAGISTESGIPDFRSPGGIWSQSQPVYFDDFVRSPSARYEYWRQKSIAHRNFADSKPNVGHQALAQWEELGHLTAVITQNIDGLHQDAGSREVVEIHGTARWIACLKCEHREEAGPLVAEFLETDVVPRCRRCAGMMKHATISFGQMLDEQTVARATELSSQADLFFAIGSSLVVYPAAGFPVLAKRSGARLVIINRDPTDQDHTADAVINASIGETLAAIDRLLSGI